MFSFLNTLNSFIFSTRPSIPGLDSIISQLDEAIDTVSESPDPQETSVPSFGCFYKTGYVTSVTPDSLLIDDVYFCDRTNCAIPDPQVGMKVQYLGYQKSLKDQMKVRSVLNVYDDEGSLTIHKQLMKKCIVAKVMNREGRLVLLDPQNIVINLDSIDSSFVPYVGDWVKIECFVEVDEEFSDLGGLVLEVEKLRPLRSNLKIGIVTHFDGKTGTGGIGADTIFSKVSCQPGYIPWIGDKVVCDCIESDQGTCSWRCLSVVPLQVQAASHNSEKLLKILDKNDPLMRDKNGVRITEDLNLSLEIEEEKKFEVLVENHGQSPQVFNKGIFMSKKAQSQLTLLSPQIDQMQTINPAQSLPFVFRVKAKFVGSIEELFIFSFKGFSIGRNIRITVNTKILSGSRGIIGGSRGNKLIVRGDDYDQENYIPGVRPMRPPHFRAGKWKTFSVPRRLWDIILAIVNERKSQTEGEVILGEEIPCLNERLTIDNYRNRFHNLLYLEQISLTIDMSRYDMGSAVLRASHEFLVLEVPGLSEKRPSLMIGDRAVVSFKYDSSGGNLRYEGCIHKVTSCEVFMQFNQRFHDNYHGEDCQVAFKSSYSSISKCHNAVDLAVENLTREILFPTRVQEKEPQIILEEDETSGTNEQNNSNSKLVNPCKLTPDTSLKKKKLIWFNKFLNVHQKIAVKNILLGTARPLPYVIFGPPGTGKTITLCETILQLLTTLPQSRLLIATPSNSSANLIAERLLDSGALKPGDLVRLIANHCLQDDSIPERLIPYCATGNLAAESSVGVSRHYGEGVRTNCTTSVLGRHRITIGTSIALGQLHLMGFPRGHFSHILVDEAGQATEPEILVPLTLIEAQQGQIILAGDPMQLEPVVNSRYARFLGLAESFLVRVLQQFPYQRDLDGFSGGYDPRLVTKLVINYRSLPEILKLPNDLFYDSTLEANLSGVDSEEANLLETLREVLPERVGKPPAIVFHGVCGEDRQDDDSPSWYNPAEAIEVYLYLLKLYGCGIEGEDVGVITPYQRQVKRIRELLMELDVTVPKVGSVEEFQGQERKIIILSTVRSGRERLREDVKHALGFVASPRRLNVAITRARTLLIIIGNTELLYGDPYWRSVIKYCIKNHSYTGCDFVEDENVEYYEE